MNFSDTEGVYTHTFEAERNVCLSLTLTSLSAIYIMSHKNYHPKRCAVKLLC